MAYGPTYERVSGRSVPPMPIRFTFGVSRAAIASITGRLLVMTVTPSPRSTILRATKYAVELESRKMVSRGESICHGLLGEARLGLGGDLDALGERVLLRGDRRQDGAAVRAAGDALALELGEVAAGGHRRHAEARLDLGDGHGARVTQQVGDRGPARHGQHRPV